jgi:hypothetical protein
MRSTKATAAVERLKVRTGNKLYSMSLAGDGMFSLVLGTGEGTPPVAQGEPLPLDEFVKFVNGFGPQTPKRVSKLDLAFEAQLQKRKPP